MKELWVKKTIMRRYLIEDDMAEEVSDIIYGCAERAEELIGDFYDKNETIEYDNEEAVMPIQFQIQDIVPIPTTKGARDE